MSRDHPSLPPWGQTSVGRQQPPSPSSLSPAESLPATPSWSNWVKGKAPGTTCLLPGPDLSQTHARPGNKTLNKYVLATESPCSKAPKPIFGHGVAVPSSGWLAPGNPLRPFKKTKGRVHISIRNAVKSTDPHSHICCVEKR